MCVGGVFVPISGTEVPLGFEMAQTGVHAITTGLLQYFYELLFIEMLINDASTSSSNESVLSWFVLYLFSFRVVYRCEC